MATTRSANAKGTTRAIECRLESSRSSHNESVTTSQVSLLARQVNARVSRVLAEATVALIVVAWWATSHDL